jgi:hypothetical protein
MPGEKRKLILSLQKPESTRGNNIYVILSREGTIAVSNKEFDFHITYPLFGSDGQIGKTEIRTSRESNSAKVRMSDNYGVFLDDLIKTNDCQVNYEQLVSDAVEAKDILKKIKDLNK